jgi:hypothetical protein
MLVTHTWSVTLLSRSKSVDGGRAAGPVLRVRHILAGSPRGRLAVARLPRLRPGRAACHPGAGIRLSVASAAVNTALLLASSADGVLLASATRGRAEPARDRAAAADRQPEPPGGRAKPAGDRA